VGCVIPLLLPGTGCLNPGVSNRTLKDLTVASVTLPAPGKPEGISKVDVEGRPLKKKKGRALKLTAFPLVVLSWMEQATMAHDPRSH
jgi:hypothetical protein